MSKKRKTTKSKNDDGPGIYEIRVDGKPLERLSANNKKSAIEIYKSRTQTAAGEVTAEKCSGNPTRGDAAQYAKDLDNLAERVKQSSQLHICSVKVRELADQWHTGQCDKETLLSAIQQWYESREVASKPDSKAGAAERAKEFVDNLRKQPDDEFIGYLKSQGFL